MSSAVESETLGRDAERAELARVLDVVADGPVALLLEGEAGIGKTTVWRDGIALAAEQGFRVLACAPAELERDLPFAALGDCLEPVLDEALPSLPGALRSALEVALLRGDATARVPNQRAVSVASLAVVRSLATAGPLLLGVDDANWLDPASARVLEFTLRRLKREPVAVLVTQRRGETPSTPLGLERSLPDDRFARLVLAPLPPEVLDRLLRGRLGAAFLRPTLLQLHRASGGNPFFALEIGRALLTRTEGLAPGEPLPVPDNLRALIGERLARLPGRVRETLQAVAALSDPTGELLQDVVGPVAESHLATAAAEGLVVFDGDRIRFSHPLLAAEVYAGLTPVAKRRLHELLAERVPGLEERARHLALGAQHPDPKVASVLDEAARRVLARGAPETAAEFSEHACRLTPADAVDDLRRRTVEAADHHLQAGDTARARTLLEEVLAGAPRGEMRASALLRLARVRSREEGAAVAAQLLERALAGTGDRGLRASIELDLTIHLLQSGALGRADVHARMALELADALGEPDLLLDAMANAAMVDFLRGKGLRIDLMRRAASLLERESLDPGQVPPRLFHPELVWGTLLKWADDFEPARDKLERLLRLARERHEEGWLVPILFQLGELECWFGNWDVAGRYADEAHEAALQSGSPAAEVPAMYLRALVDAHLGRAGARAAADVAASASERTSNLRHLIRSRALCGFVALSLGDSSDACRHLGAAEELSRAGGYADPSVLRFHADLIEALVGVGELERAATLTDELVERGRTLDRPWAVATSNRCRALVCAARGDTDEALRALAAALTAHESLLQPFEFARTLLVLGSVRRRARQKRPAREALERGHDLFERLGAPLWAAKARDQLGRIGGRAPAPEGLTPTEEKIVELVAAGCTNPEIAEALFMSRKTVETHLTRLFRKLEVRSRRELARAVARSRATEGA